jgi:hypothetical protein
MESATNENTNREVRILSWAGSDESPENADGMGHRVSQRNFPGNPRFNGSEKSKKVQKGAHGSIGSGGFQFAGTN